MVSGGGVTSFSAEKLGVAPADILFVGLGRSAVAWYRCYLPAMFMGADYIGLEGQPPEYKATTGQRRREDLADYKVVVLQQPREGWTPIILKLKERGIKVLFEVDDYLHGIAKMTDHDFAQGFSKKKLAVVERNMALCDGLICSTEFIARRYSKFNRNVHVCEIGLDLARYALTRPPRPTINVGWSGATGHARAMRPWLEAVRNVMRRHENVCFVTVGQSFADVFVPEFGTRAISVPFTLLDQYPAAMTLFDVALAPSGKGNFFKGKSDLRWLEAGALGIPLIGDPDVYWRIEHGVDGFHAESADEAEEHLERLVAAPSLRLQVGENAQEYVVNERSMKVAVEQWRMAIADVCSPAGGHGGHPADTSRLHS